MLENILWPGWGGAGAVARSHTGLRSLSSATYPDEQEHVYRGPNVDGAESVQVALVSPSLRHCSSPLVVHESMSARVTVEWNLELATHGSKVHRRSHRSTLGRSLVEGCSTRRMCSVVKGIRRQTWRNLLRTGTGMALQRSCHGKHSWPDWSVGLHTRHIGAECKIHLRNVSWARRCGFQSE